MITLKKNSYLNGTKGTKKRKRKKKMPVHDELGKRMKGYENESNPKLVKKLPVIIRVDGRAFHTFSRKLEKPFDDILIDSMHDTMRYLCKNIAGCVLGYCQSDEISLLLQDYKNDETQPWFDYRLNKLCSVAASMATFAFNRAFEDKTTEFCNNWSIGNYREDFEKDDKRISVLAECCNKGALFDARAFVLPFNEVTNYFYWREADAMRNSVEMVGHANFSQKQLHKVNTEGIKKMLLEKGINYDDIPVYKQRGVCCIKTKMPSFSPDNKPVMKNVWVLDIDIPIFKGEGREYIESKIGDRYYE